MSTALARRKNPLCACGPSCHHRPSIMTFVAKVAEEDPLLLHPMAMQNVFATKKTSSKVDFGLSIQVADYLVGGELGRPERCHSNPGIAHDVSTLLRPHECYIECITRLTQHVPAQLAVSASA